MIAGDGAPAVVEFNCRFGDPEAEAVLPILPPGLVADLDGIARGAWRPRAAVVAPSGASVTTVLASRGYPEDPEAGARIDLPPDPGDGVIVFHAGTARDERGTLRVKGGRVLAVTALGATVAAAADASRAACERIAFDGKVWRRDIAWRELARAGAA
jgi:phosphoribosylamine--glycine ligase